MNIAGQINDVIRRVDLTGPGNIIVLTQTFPTTAADLWDACTDPQRLSRWFEPVKGDLHLHGRYELVDSGTAGTIDRCDPPHTLSITWEHGEDHSRVEADIHPASDVQVTLTIRHFGDDNEHWDTYGPAAGGTGWDLSLLALSRHLEDGRAGAAAEVEAHMATDLGQQQMTDFASVWRDAHIAAGADPDHAATAAKKAGDGNRELWSGASS